MGLCFAVQIGLEGYQHNNQWDYYRFYGAEYKSWKIFISMFSLDWVVMGQYKQIIVLKLSLSQYRRLLTVQ
ncbi:MAG: hypothetical protein CSB47_05355 [Proteobacteria bacterium]|nr:MAG: hypothetical protein CSB47_05355 [Pseudomonadota bacterium]